MIAFALQVRLITAVASHIQTISERLGHKASFFDCGPNFSPSSVLKRVRSRLDPGWRGIALWQSHLWLNASPCRAIGYKPGVAVGSHSDTASDKDGLRYHALLQDP